mgnify:FL=1
MPLETLYNVLVNSLDYITCISYEQILLPMLLTLKSFPGTNQYLAKRVSVHYQGRTGAFYLGLTSGLTDY